MKAIASIEDLRAGAKRRLPRMFFDFVDGAAYSETTCRKNRSDLDAILLNQTICVDVSGRNTETTLLGERLKLPIVLAPTGLSGMLWPNGEIAAARAAAEARIPYCLSTMSCCSMEQLAAAAPKPFWFQLYMLKDRGFVRALVERAQNAGCRVLVLTADVPALGQRHRDVRNGLTVPLRFTARTVLDIASRPMWALQALRAGPRTFGNLIDKAGGGSAGSIAEWINKQFDDTMGWQDVEWLRSIWRGKLVVKGVLNAKDAEQARNSGADGIVVSNHGGRQLDGARSSISVLDSVVQKVGSDLEVIVDSGFRSGQDVLRALALGARACMLGRAFLYGLACNGQAGVARAIEIIRGELVTTMALCGVRNIAEIDGRVLAPMTHDSNARMQA
ncbi:MAG: alpha-hydroxy acid oxidase [Pseudolabrys sp.]|nr:alpha-hydroxy acid oxidase [Pseudolabrys sp.]